MEMSRTWPPPQNLPVLPEISRRSLVGGMPRSVENTDFRPVICYHPGDEENRYRLYDRDEF